MVKGSRNDKLPRRWPRVPPALAWKRPGLPTDWTRVLERHPDEVAALPGYVWLDTPRDAGVIWLQLMRMSLGARPE